MLCSFVSHVEVFFKAVHPIPGDSRALANLKGDRSSISALLYIIREFPKVVGAVEGHNVAVVIPGYHVRIGLTPIIVDMRSDQKISEFLGYIEPRGIAMLVPRVPGKSERGTAVGSQCCQSRIC